MLIEVLQYVENVQIVRPDAMNEAQVDQLDEDQAYDLMHGVDNLIEST